MMQAGFELFFCDGRQKNRKKTSRFTRIFRSDPKNLSDVKNVSESLKYLLQSIVMSLIRTSIGKVDNLTDV